MLNNCSICKNVDDIRAFHNWRYYRQRRFQRCR